MILLFDEATCDTDTSTTDCIPINHVCISAISHPLALAGDAEQGQGCWQSLSLRQVHICHDV